MILIAFGSNLPGPGGSPAQIVRSAIDTLDRDAGPVTARSRLYASPAVPVSDQPDFINAVAGLETDLQPHTLMALLHDIEARFGRTRHVRWEARLLDLDLIDYRQFVTCGIDAVQAGRSGAPQAGEVARPEPLALPHPRAHERAFVLKPIAEIAPDWRHPLLNRTAADLLADVADAQSCQPLDGL